MPAGLHISGPYTSQAASPTRRRRPERRQLADTRWQSSEFLRPKKRDNEIDEDAGSEHAAQDIDPGHRGLLINLSQPCTSPMLRATKSTISAMYRMSMFARP